MTKLREPLTVEYLLSQSISKLDENEIKNVTNKSISHFRKCSDPDDKDHNLHFNDAVMFDILMQRKSLGTPFMDNFSLLLEDEFNKINVEEINNEQMARIYNNQIKEYENSCPPQRNYPAEENLGIVASFFHLLK